MEEIKDRLEGLDLPFAIQYNFRVEKHLKDYLVYGQRQSAHILKSLLVTKVFECIIEDL